MLRELLASFGFEWDASFEREATSSIANVVGAVQSLSQAFLASSIVTAGAAFVQNMIDVGSELADTSAQMGISATELAEWRFAAGLAGVEANELSGALTRVAVLARGGGGGVFARLGVSTRDAAGELRRASDILEDTGLAIGAMENETERTAMAVQVFGRSGRALIPLFRGTRGSIRELRAEVRNLYGTDLDRLSEVADEAGDNQDRLNLVFDAFRTRLSLSVLPVVTDALERLVAVGQAIAEVTQHSRVLQAGMVILGAAMAAAALLTIGMWGPPLLIFALVALAVGALVLIVDDLLVMLEGGNSVIGGFIDQIFGVGTAASVSAGILGAFNLAVAQMEIALFAVRGALTAAFGPEVAEMLTTVGGIIETITNGLRTQVLMARLAADALGLDGSGVGAIDGSAVGPTAIAAATGATTVTDNRSVGTIIVNGSGDPERVAREVVRLGGVGDTSVEDDALDLVPEAG